MAALARSKYWRQGDAETALDALTASGQSLTDFARQWGLNDRRLRRWQRRLQRPALQPTGGEVTRAFRQVEIVVDDELHAGSGVELVLRGGHRVILHRGFDGQVLEELLRVLDVAC
jgi:hypothetical protein